VGVFGIMPLFMVDQTELPKFFRIPFLFFGHHGNFCFSRRNKGGQMVYEYGAGVEQ